MADEGTDLSPLVQSDAGPLPTLGQWKQDSESGVVQDWEEPPAADASAIDEIVSDGEDQVVAADAPAEGSGAGISGFEQLLRKDLANPQLAEQYSSLSSKVIEGAGLPGVIMVVGAEQQAHVSETLTHMAMMLVDRGAVEVLLVDANLKNRLLSRRFEIDTHSGLAEVCDAEMDWHGLLVSGTDSHLSILPAGKRLSPLKATIPTVARLVEQWKQEFRIVLVDVGDTDSPFAEAFAQASDAAYLLVRLGESDRMRAQSAVSSIQSMGGNLKGCIVTNAPASEAAPA